MGILEFRGAQFDKHSTSTTMKANLPNPITIKIKERKEIFRSFEIVLSVEFLHSNNGLEDIYVYKTE